MAKIVWWITVIIVALINEVAPFHMQEQTFYFEDYYTSTLGVDNPAAIYAQFYGLDYEDKHICNPRQMSQLPEGYKYNQLNKLMYFLATKEGITPSDYEIPEGEICPIVIPYSYEIVTNIKASDKSTSITLKCSLGADTYTIGITGMECWFCCYNNGIRPECGFYQHYGVTAEDYKNTYAANSVVGFANSNTKFQIINSAGYEVTIQQFYDGTGNDVDAEEKAKDPSNLWSTRHASLRQETEE